MLDLRDATTRHGEGTGSVLQEPSAHAVHFFTGEATLHDTITQFLAEGLDARQPVILFATRMRREAVEDRLRSHGWDLAELRRRDLFTALDARETLAQLMADHGPDEQRFRACVGNAIDRIAHAHPHARVRAYGEMVDVLWRQGDTDAALRLEDLWNDLTATQPISLLCTYAMGSFHRESHGAGFREVCRRHAHVIPAQIVPLDGDARDQAIAIAHLQQRALALEAEIEHRKELEKALRESLAQRRAVEERLQRSERELRDFLENAVEGMQWVGPDGIILWANRAQLELLGYAEDEYVGHHIAEFHVDQEAIGAILQRLANGGELREHEIGMRCRNGAIRYLLVNSNVAWENGEFVHSRCFMRDISERRQAEHDLRTAKDEAERANHAKSDFLAAMSHELRTPLNAIIGYHDLLEQEVGGPLTSSQRDYLNRLRRSAQQLLRLIDQILGFSRIAAGKEELDITTVDLTELVHEVAEQVEPVAGEKGLRLTVEVENGSLTCRTDDGKVRQILLNLLSNAVKFTPEGDVAVSAAIRGGMARFTVRDTGVGIEPAHLEQIFEPFVQVGRSKTHSQGGTGLGLPLSRNLAALLGGDLRVQSTPGKGSTFTLSIPTL